MADPKRFFVIFGQNGPQIVGENLNEFTKYSGEAFPTRIQAEEWLRSHFKDIEPREASSTQENCYPNSSQYWEENPAPSSRVLNRDVRTHDTPPRLLTPPPETTTPELEGPTQPPGNIILSPEQKHVLDMVKRGQSVFFTGPAGTGKSVLLREIVLALKTKYSDPSAVAVTASTGIAGVNIGGQTIHSFSGIRLGKEKKEVLARRIWNHDILRARWNNTKVLIIDEISMLEGRIFDKIEYIARYVRKNNKPFGGIQLVLSGDFCQLPPVPDESHQHKLPSSFAFQAEAWKLCIGKPVLLTHVFRQKDKAFVDILASLRVGDLSDSQVDALLALSRPLVYDDGIEPSYLFPLRSQVQECNRRRLRELPGPSVTYQAMDSAGYDVDGNRIPREQAFRLLDRLIALNEITVKVGAQVMLIHNVVQGCMVNGSCGKVVSFMTTHEALERKIQITEIKGRKDSLPDPPPQAAQRPRQDHELIPLNSTTFKATQEWPLVRFGSDPKDLLLCAPVDFTVEGYIGNVEAGRLQVPLILSWALSIHKSQGQTLQRVKIDLSKIFEKGQAYVAISRATSMEHLELLNFSPLVVRADPLVVAWQREWLPKSALPQPSQASNPTQSLSTNQSTIPVQVQPQHDPDDDLWDEMNSEEAILQYHSACMDYI